MNYTATNSITTLPASLTRQISLQASDDAELQSLFASGLLWCYGFHHEEAQRHFRQLLARDSDNTLGLWGLAYASAPFYNRPWSWFTDKQKDTVAALGFTCLQQAIATQNAGKTDTRSDLNIDLVNALSTLWRSPQPVSDGTFLEYQHDYADKMLVLARRYSDQTDIVTLAAEALINCTPWQLWDIEKRKQATGSRVDEALALLQQSLGSEQAASHNHPGVLHLHIHALEMSPHPEHATDSAAAIKQLVPKPQPTQTGKNEKSSISASVQFPPHLPHMASHIDILQGNYRNSIDINKLATEADNKIAAVEGEFYAISRLHNVHMTLYAAMMAGRQSDAIDAAFRLQSLAATLYTPDCETYLKVSIEGFFSNGLHAYVRFGKWQEIIQKISKPLGNDCPNDLRALPFARALQSYAGTVALANSKAFDKAKQESDNFQKLKALVPEHYMINNNSAGDTLAVASRMLSGELLYHTGQVEGGLTHLRLAVEACDQLAYCEPRAWMHPPRHALGALLLEQHQVDEAREVYETDLGLNGLLARCQQNPKNIWALQGLLECYQRLGFNSQGFNRDKLEQARQEAIAYADINISSSCFCRGSSAGFQQTTK